MLFGFKSHGFDGLLIVGYSKTFGEFLHDHLIKSLIKIKARYFPNEMKNIAGQFHMVHEILIAHSFEPHNSSKFLPKVESFYLKETT